MSNTWYCKEDVNKQEDVLVDYIETANYINAVLDRYKSIQTLDKNDIYDLIYVEVKMQDILSKGTDNKDLMNSITDTLNRVKVITKLLSNNIINQASKINIDKNKVKAINRIKYHKNNGLGSIRNIAKVSIKNESPMKKYIKNLLPSIIILIICTAFIMSGKIRVALNQIYSWACITTSSEASRNTVVGIANTAISTVAILLVIEYIIKVCIDFLYISFPYTRYIFDNKNYLKKKIISDEAIKIVEQSNEDLVTEHTKANRFDLKRKIISDEAIKIVKQSNEDLATEYTKANRFDREDIALALLNNMEKIVDKKGNSELYAELKLLMKEVKKGSTRDRLYALAKAELIYLKNRDKFNNETMNYIY